MSDDIRDRMDGRDPNAGPDRPGEGYASDRPGNEYGAGAEGYAGRERMNSAGTRPGDGAYGSGGPNWSPGAGYGDYGSRRSAFDGFRDAASGAGPRFLDDMARFVTDAAGAAQGVRREVETAFRAQAESVLGRMDVVRRDEFEAVAEMASRARAENDELRARLDALEAKLGSSPSDQPE